MKELSLEEVLRIAGGVPLAAALDELTYRTSEPVPDRRDGAQRHDTGVGPPHGD